MTIPRRQHISKRLLMTLVVLGLTACAGQSPGSGGELSGVGTPGVSAYVGENQATSVQAMLYRCRQVPQQSDPAPGDRGLSAACAQLRRTLRSQPGNTVEAGATP
jgi:hypothetical protein